MTAPDGRELKLPAYVILGMLRLGARSGYDIKQVIDLAGRHFWTISYPQIYPELERLQALKYVTGKDDLGSARRRRLYALTSAGERELERWLQSDQAASLEIRDLGLLKILFAQSPDEARQHLAAMRRRSRETIAFLEARARPAATGIDAQGNSLALVTIELGIELHRHIVRTCRKLERALDDAARV